MEHLACYLPGNLALGVAEGAVGGEKAVQYASVAEELTHTCMQMYMLMPTGRTDSLYDTLPSVMHAVAAADRFKFASQVLSLPGQEGPGAALLHMQMCPSVRSRPVPCICPSIDLKMTKDFAVQALLQKRLHFWRKEGRGWMRLTQAMCCGLRLWRACITCGG